VDPPAGVFLDIRKAHFFKNIRGFHLPPPVLLP
jgi:hypothetical protein